MKIYASSYKLCADPSRLRALFSGSTRIAVISNALDFSTDLARRERGVAAEMAELSKLGLQPESIDLRHFFGNARGTQDMLGRFDGLWVTGGNVFTLRRAYRYSGLDTALHQIAAAGTPFVHAGYSAGSCVLGSTLDGLQLVDPPQLPAEGYGDEIILEGLGLLPFSIAPHFKSDHPESRQIDEVVAYFEARGIPYRTLRDGESIVAEYCATDSNW
jgi:dipeptidase E